MKRSFYAGATAFLFVAVASHLRWTPYNNYVLLADAMAHGHLAINWPGDYIDALLYRGQYYVIEAPLPAILLFPLVKLLGTNANQTPLAVLLAGVAIGAAWELCERLEVPWRTNCWLCAFLLAGTDLLWCAMLGDVWFLAHVSAVCFTLLALVELVGKRRAYLVALFGICACESRFSMILALPVYAYLLGTSGERENDSPAQLRRRLFDFGLTLVPAAVLWVAYNEARWGTFADIGYTEWYHRDPAGMPSGSPFRIEYLPYQLQSFFLQPPTWLRSYPWVQPEITGMALTWTSPALVLAFLARQPRRFVLAMWSATLLVAVPSFLYYVNGFTQFGMRHALDFEPFMFALTAVGVRNGLPSWGKILIAYSCVVGLWGTWFWNTFLRTEW
ncbi:MAG: hypothetical protein M3160_03550 [Candidatus Eremiobacteraeota bacterium]|nr:hypothetical protein [Candidatus Eremiobacteraeota bacterium]